MLTNADIERYKELQKQVQEANAEKQTLKAEIKVFHEQGLEKLAKYGFTSYQDLPKFKEKIDQLELKVREEMAQMEEYCKYMADKKIEKISIFSKE